MTAADDPILALKLEGTAHLKSGDIAKARDAYSKALALDPEHKHAEAHILFSNRALTHLKLSSPSLAKDDCTAAGGKRDTDRESTTQPTTTRSMMPATG